MIRRLINVASALSMLLCVATVVLWVRSYFATDSLLTSRFDDDRGRTYWTQSIWRVGQGGIGLNRNVQSGPQLNFPRGIESELASVGYEKLLGFWLHHDEPAYPELNFGMPERSKWGFRWGRYIKRLPDGRVSAGFNEVVVPLWLLFVTSLLLPALWYWRRPPGVKPGTCFRCGYDLRASKDRCSECGGPIPGTAGAIAPLAATAMPRS